MSQSVVRANGIEIYCETYGQGPALTLIMGLGCSARQWQWMVPVLSESFRVITFDNRGVGRTSKPDMEYTTDLLADDMRALLEALEVEKTHLMGVSVGGMIAQQFALRHPDGLDRLVLSCSMPSFYHLPPLPEDLERLQTSGMLPPDESVQVMLNLFLSEGFRSEHSDKTNALRKIMLLEKEEQGSDPFMLQLGAAMTHDAVEEVAEIEAPTLVITGGRDPMAPPANARFLAEKIPNSRLEIIPGAHHAIWVEQYRETCSRVKAFLSDDPS